MERAHVEVEHVRRRVEGAQRAVQRQWRGGIWMADPLREHHLHDVAFMDVTLGTFHSVQESILAELGLRYARVRYVLLRNLHRLAQLGCELAQPFLRFLERARLARIGVHDQIQLARKIVDHRKLLGQQQQDIRAIERIGLGHRRELVLDIAHRLVTEHANQPAAEARQPRYHGRTKARLARRHELERILVLRLLHQLIVAILRAAVPAHFEPRVGRQADERVASEPLAALHGFEEVRPRTVGELEVDGKRSVEVSEGFQHQRDTRVTLGRKLPEIRLGHDPSTKNVLLKTETTKASRQTRRTGRGAASATAPSFAAHCFRISTFRGSQPYWNRLSHSSKLHQTGGLDEVANYSIAIQILHPLGAVAVAYAEHRTARRSRRLHIR